jgi:aminoglycoside phosphotransferase (APT) family kinase protein
MHALDLIRPDGSRLPLVIRRFGRWHLQHFPDIAARSARTLDLLARLDVPAPRSVYVDPNGALLGSPALVMTRVPGRGLLTPRDRDGYLAQLAAALARLHRARFRDEEVSYLQRPDETVDWVMQNEMDLDAVVMRPLGSEVRAAIEQMRPRLRRVTPVLVHTDYWAGNTLWSRGRLTAIVDWDNAALGPPGIDVGYVRMDLSMMLGGDAPDAFLAAYERAAGWRVPQLAFWDLFGAARALPNTEHWLPGYHDLGLTTLSSDDTRARLEAFIRSVLGPESRVQSQVDGS